MRPIARKYDLKEHAYRFSITHRGRRRICSTLPEKPSFRFATRTDETTTVPTWPPDDAKASCRDDVPSLPSGAGHSCAASAVVNDEQLEMAGQSVGS